MKIAIYGGSFNPPHIAHQLVATHVLSTCDVDELWFMPTYQHMLGKQLVSYDHRVEMVRLMAKLFGNRASVSRAEQRLAKQPGFEGSATIHLVRYVTEEWPTDQFRLIIGSDLLDQFKTWGGHEEIAERAPLIVVDRAGYGTAKGIGRHKLVLPDVSSTLVKDAYARGDDVENLVPREVLAYMRQHSLYPTTDRRS